MQEQLSLFSVEDDYFLCAAGRTLDSVSDSKNASLTLSKRFATKDIKTVSDSKLKPSLTVNKYSPGKRKTEYFRLSYRDGSRVKHIHIRGGNVNSLLAQSRVLKLQNAINNGASLEDILTLIKHW